jgi:hypothetical protein
MDKDRVVWFYTGTCCMHRHPEFTLGSHEIGEDYLAEEVCKTH